jgi:hypothetical protein
MDGTLYVASDAEKTNSVLWATKDNGKTWQDTGGRSAGRHTTFALLKDGAILGLGGKTTDIDGYMPKAISRDGGKTWTVSKTPFPALGVNQRPSLLRLQSGRLLFAGDFQKRGNIAPAGVTTRGCFVAISSDDGETWRFKKLPGTQPHEKPEYQNDPDTLGYSAMRQAPNGMIHLITTMNNPCLHFEFNETWVMSDGDPKADPELVTEARGFLRDGKQRTTFANGKSRHEVSYLHGRKTGTETLWRSDGSIAWQQVHRSDGTMVWTQFWENGAKKVESTWRGFQADGPARRWDRSGKLVSEVQFQAGAIR